MSCQGPGGSRCILLRGQQRAHSPRTADECLGALQGRPHGQPLSRLAKLAASVTNVLRVEPGPRVPSFLESAPTGMSALPNRRAIDLTRAQILAFRRHVGALDERLPPGARSLRRAAWAGLQDSMPRAALLSIHARVEQAHPSTWEDPSLVQLWGPRFSAYVVAAGDRAVFSLARFPDDARGRQVAEELAARLHAF